VLFLTLQIYSILTRREVPVEQENKQVVIAGGGPAALLLARETARRGLRTVVVAPEVAAPWHPRYAVWVDEIAPHGLESVLSPTWDECEIRADEKRARLLKRAYGRVDGKALQAQLMEECLQQGVEVVEDRVESVRHAEDSTVVELVSFGSLETSVFVDSTGHGGHFIEYTGEPARTYQVAYGIVGEMEGTGLPAADRMTLMDFTPIDDLAANDPDDIPTFLYAMPIGDGRWMMEETVLARSPRVSMHVVAARLMRRLNARGIHIRSMEHVECCRIPMDAPLPNVKQRTLGFGGAASMVHPATGYMLGQVVTAAPKLAESLAASLGEGVDLQEVSERAWKSIWSPGERRRHKLHKIGGRICADLTAQETRDFFFAFFEMQPELWSGFLSRDLSTLGLLKAMMKTFVGTSTKARWSMTKGLLAHLGDASGEEASEEEVPGEGSI